MISKIRVLSIDGGGIRGIIPACILAHMEQLLKEISRDRQAQISDYFDLVAGTSTGGILTALLLYPGQKYSATDLIELYAHHGQTIFTRNTVTRQIDRMGLFRPMYQHEPLERLLQHYLGDLKVSELVRPALIPTYNIESGVATFVSSLAIEKNPKQDCRVCDVLRATTAAPTYFSPTKQKRAAFIDGGMFANNPALCAYIEATKFPSDPSAKEMMLLSLGTGSINRRYAYGETQKWGRLNWIRPALDIYASAASQTVNHQLEIFYAHQNRAGNYLRIEPDLKGFTADFRMDKATPDNIQQLLKVGEAMCQQYEAPLRAFLRQVVLSNVLSPHDQLYL